MTVPIGRGRRVFKRSPAAAMRPTAPTPIARVCAGCSAS